MKVGERPLESDIRLKAGAWRIVTRRVFQPAESGMQTPVRRCEVGRSKRQPWLTQGSATDDFDANGGPIADAGDDRV